MPLTYLSMLFSSLVAINYPESTGPSIFLDKSGRGREGSLSTKQWLDRTFRCEGSPGGHLRNFWVGMCCWDPGTRASSAEFCYPILEGVRLRVSSSSAASVGTCFGSWVSRIDLHTKAQLHYILKSTNIILYLKKNAPWHVVQLRDDLKEAVFAGKMFRIRFGGEKPLDRMNYDDLAVS